MSHYENYDENQYEHYAATASPSASPAGLSLMTRKVLSVTLAVLAVVHLLVSVIQMMNCGNCMKNGDALNPFAKGGKGPWLLSLIVMLLISVVAVWHVISVFDESGKIEDLLA